MTTTGVPTARRAAMSSDMSSCDRALRFSGRLRVIRVTVPSSFTIRLSVCIRPFCRSPSAGSKRRKHQLPQLTQTSTQLTLTAMSSRAPRTALVCLMLLVAQAAGALVAAAQDTPPDYPVPPTPADYQRPIGKLVPPQGALFGAHADQSNKP